MMIMTPRESCEAEISRFFKKYYTFTSSSDSDDLNNLLSSLCSSIEKYEIATNENVSKDNRRYLALKTLRNYALHHSELLNDSKGISASDISNVRADVSLLCLLPVKTIERVIINTRQDKTKKYIREEFIFYDNFVDIYPAIFNFAVDLYFLTIKNSLNIVGESYLNMKRSIQYEVSNNYPHYISGKIISLNGVSISDYIDKHVIDMDVRIKENKMFMPIDGGMGIITSKQDLSPLEQLNRLSEAEKNFIYLDLISTNAVEFKNGKEGKCFTESRPLTPIEILILNNMADSSN
uniref:Uncharacterized protein n=1 Tax=Serratia proteamaculans (strain 568) TaxID=399741 RepID=A8GC02_SERP5